MQLSLVTQNIFCYSALVWDMIAFTLNQQMAPQYVPNWREAGDFKLIFHKDILKLTDL